MMEFIDLRYWYEAWAYGLLRVSVWVILIPAAMMGIGLVLAAIAKQGQRRKRLVGGALLMLLVVLVSPFTFGFKEEVAFRRACYEEAGLHVYQKIELGPKYWLKIDPEKGLVKKDDTRWVFEELGYEINLELFEKIYEERRGRSSNADYRSYKWELLDSQTGKRVAEIKNFFGGPTRFLSQRDRDCNNLKSYHKPSFMDYL